MYLKFVDSNSKAVTIEILPYYDCYNIAVANLISKGYDEKKVHSSEESDILGNVPFMVFGGIFRARKGLDINGVECYYLCTTGYKIPLDFIKEIV